MTIAGSGRSRRRTERPSRVARRSFVGGQGFRGAYILAGGYDLARAEADLAAGKGDLVAFSRPFLANPRLVDKLAQGGELHPPDPATFYTPGEKGYIDWPL